MLGQCNAAIHAPCTAAPSSLFISHFQSTVPWVTLTKGLSSKRRYFTVANLPCDLVLIIGQAVEVWAEILAFFFPRSVTSRRRNKTEFQFLIQHSLAQTFL